MNDIIKELNESNLFNYVYYDGLIDIKDLESKLINVNKRPTLGEIIHKITLETVFETKESLTEFIDNLVKQYSK